MPELPEVETIVRQLQPLVGRTITGGSFSWPRTAENLSPDTLIENLAGSAIRAVTRRGKFLIFHLREGYLIGHLRMTGRISITTSHEAERFERFQLHLDKGQVLHYQDSRKFGRWGLYPNLDRLAHLGPEPLECSADELAHRLARTRRHLKVALLDQTLVAGLGNIYVDETLWLAEEHPLTPAPHANAERLCEAMQHVLTQAISAGGSSLGDGQANYYTVEGKRGGMQGHLQVFRRQGNPCPRCTTPIERMVVGGRGTHLCPSCQTLRVENPPSTCKIWPVTQEASSLSR